MSHFLIITILISVLGTECFAAQHTLLETVTDYFNAKSSIRNLLDDKSSDVNNAPRANLACAQASARVFRESMQSLIKSKDSDVKGKKNRGDSSNTSTQVDTKEKFTLLSVQDEKFSEYFVQFLAGFWNTVLIDTNECITKDGNDYSKKEVSYSNIARKLERFTADLFHRCKIPFAFYPGLTFRRKYAANVENVKNVELDEIAEASLQDNMNAVYQKSRKFITSFNNPIMINLMDGLQKSRSVGCVRNASFTLISELKRLIPGGCPQANENISKLNSMVLLKAQPARSVVVKDLLRQLSMLQAPDGLEPAEILMDDTKELFKSTIEDSINELKKILGIFEECVRDEKFPPPYDQHARKLISIALNDFDLDIVKCEVPLEYIHPSIKTGAIIVNLDDLSTQAQPPISPSQYIKFKEPTIIAEFFKENEPHSVKCFKKSSSNLFEEMKTLLIDACPDGDNWFAEFETKVMTEILIKINTHVDIQGKDFFEIGMKDLDNYGLQTFNAYRLCLENEDFFEKNEKIREFADMIVHFQDVYEACGGELLIPKPPEPQTSNDSEKPELAASISETGSEIK